MKSEKKRITILAAGIFVISALFLIVASSAYTKQIEIKWWDWETNPQGAKRVVFERAFEQYEKEHPEVRLVAEHFPYEVYPQKILAGTAAHTGPVIAMIEPDNRARYLTPVPIIEPLPESLFPYEKMEQEYENVEQFKWIDGKYYQISGGWDINVTFYNKKIFDEKGIPLPSKWDELPCSWEEFITIAKKVTEIDSKGNIVRAGMSDVDTNIFFLNLLYQFGGSLTKDNASKPNINTEAGLKAVNLIRDIYVKDKLIIPSSFFEGAWDDFIYGRTAIRIDEGWATDYLGNEENTALDMQVGPQPFVEKPGKPGVPKFYYGMLFPPSSPIVFSAFPKETKDAAWKFIKFLYEEGYMTDLALHYNQLPTRKADQKLIEERNFKYKTTSILKKYVPFSASLVTYPYRILEAITQMTEEISIGGVEPAVALERAHKRIGEILSEKEVWGIKDIR